MVLFLLIVSIGIFIIFYCFIITIFLIIPLMRIKV